MHFHRLQPQTLLEKLTVAQLVNKYSEDVYYYKVWGLVTASWTLVMESVGIFKKSVNFYENTRHINP